jgi:hypothetical protein
MWQIVLGNVELNLISKNSWKVSDVFWKSLYDFCCFLEVLSFHNKIKKEKSRFLLAYPYVIG